MRFLFVLILIQFPFLAQSASIRGYIRDAKNDEALISASCIDGISKRGITTNSSGFYSFSLSKGAVTITAAYMGYQPQTISFRLNGDTLIDFRLIPIAYSVDEVVVTAERSLHEQTLMGRIELSAEKLNLIPSFTGESDLMKAITTLPGIAGGREGFSNIFVRGGDRGQNLILLDGAKLYNTNHLGGLVSLFNTNIIKTVELYKGGFPASYGGRASSVIDIHTREGNRHAIKGKYNVGVLSSGLILDGPLSEKISFLLAARSSYYDLITIPARIKYNRNKNNGLYDQSGYAGYLFFDINAKLNYYADNGVNYFANFYTGHDFDQSTDLNSSYDYLSKMTVHNTCFTLGSKYSPAPRLFWSNRLTFSRYENGIENEETQIQHNIDSRYTSLTQIDEVNLNSQLEGSFGDIHHAKIGVDMSGYQFLPAKQSSHYEDGTVGIVSDITIQSMIQNTMELSVYGEDEIRFNEALFLNMGLRGVAYFCKDKTYTQIEPRISARALLSKNISVKANYTVMNQSNHVLVNRYGVFEKEIWLASTKQIAPQQARQFSAGVFTTIKSLKLDLSVEAFYKKMSNLLDYHAPALEESKPNNIEKEIITGGAGLVRGIECQLKYSDEQFSGEINYTYSHNIRKFDQLNNGKWYPFIYDRPHDLSLLLSYRIKPGLTVNSNFVYATGTPFTMPEGHVNDGKYSLWYYIFSSKNNMRLPNYHRLDLSLVKTGKTQRGNTKQWSFNVFNAYARQNAVYIYNDSNTGRVYQKSMFSIIPTISYSCEF